LETPEKISQSELYYKAVFDATRLSLLKFYKMDEAMQWTGFSRERLCFLMRDLGITKTAGGFISAKDLEKIVFKEASEGVEKGLDKLNRKLKIKI
jgi:hypothetical protein